MSSSAHNSLSVQFLTKPSMTHVSHLPYLPNLAPSDFVPWMKKVRRGNTLQMWKRLNKEQHEYLSGFNIDEFKNCFAQWAKVSIGV